MQLVIKYIKMNCFIFMFCFLLLNNFYFLLEHLNFFMTIKTSLLLSFDNVLQMKNLCLCVRYLFFDQSFHFHLFEEIAIF